MKSAKTVGLILACGLGLWTTAWSASWSSGDEPRPVATSSHAPPAAPSHLEPAVSPTGPSRAAQASQPGGPLLPPPGIEEVPPRQEPPPAFDDEPFADGEPVKPEWAPPTDEELLEGRQPVAIEVPTSPRRTELERAYDAAESDPTRTVDLRAYLSQLARDSGLPAEVVRDADCRGPVCRVRLGFDGMSDAMRFQDVTRASEFEFEMVPTAISGPPTMKAEPEPDPEKKPWEMVLLLTPREA